MTETSSQEMTATDVHACLDVRWPDDAHLKIREAPQGSSRDGRKIDLLVIHLWQSRGLAVEAVEVKVSVSDFKREIAEPAKTDFWWRHSERFWIAAPADVAKKIIEDMPPTWGLIACYPDGKTRVRVKATKRDRQSFGWQTTVGMLRASADSGFNALQRAEQRGFERGKEQGAKQARSDQPASHQEWQDLNAVEQARGIVENAQKVKEETGIELLGADFRLDRSIGALKILTRHTPEQVTRVLGAQREYLDRIITELGEL